MGNDLPPTPRAGNRRSQAKAALVEAANAVLAEIGNLTDCEVTEIFLTYSHVGVRYCDGLEGAIAKYRERSSRLPGEQRAKGSLAQEWL
jgi:hypothetical protein